MEKQVEFAGHKFSWHETSLTLTCHNPKFITENGRQVDATEWPAAFELSDLLGLEMSIKGYGRAYSKGVA
jgi:hypothetical protein